MRMLYCRFEIFAYQQFVREKWRFLQVDGKDGYVVKEKIKLIKHELKQWHHNHVQNLPKRIPNIKDRIAVLESKEQIDPLSDSETEELHEMMSDLHSLSRINTSICWQQSQLLWLKEGDANSKFFNDIISNRRRGNHLNHIVSDGDCV